MDVNNLLKIHALINLAKEPLHGYDLKKNLELLLKKRVSTSQIYPFLKKLQKQELVEAEKNGSRGKKVYHLTVSGKKLTKELLSHFEAITDFAVKTRLITCAHCRCKVYSGEYKTIINKKILHFCCCHCAKSFTKSFIEEHKH